MSEPVKLHTSLPGLPDVQIWLDVDWIVVRYGELVSYDHALGVGGEEVAALKTALAEARA